MKFCDKFCCFPTKDCENIGEIALNSSGYHKVCNFHYDSVQNMILCGYCESLVMITCKAYAPEESTSQENEEVYCIDCEDSHRLGYHTKSICFRCQSEFLRNEITCNHIQCNECSNYIYCPNCLSTEFSNSLKNYYFFKCGHLACDHIHERNTNLYTPEGQVQNCSNCNIITYIFREYASLTENYQNFYCWKCINDSICTICNKQSKLIRYHGKFRCQACSNSYYQLCQNCNNNSYEYLYCGHLGCSNCEGLDKCTSCKYKYYSDSNYKNYCTNCNAYENCSKCDCDHLRCIKCLENKLCLACKQETHQLKLEFTLNSDQNIIHNSYEECLDNPARDNKLENQDIIIHSINSKDSETSFANTQLRPRKCPNCGNNSEYYLFECSHEGCLYCSDESFCNICLNKKKEKCLNCKRNIQATFIFDCNHIPCFECVDKACDKCNPKGEKKECSRCLKQSFVGRPNGDSNYLCEHYTCYSCIVYRKNCKKCNSIPIDVKLEQKDSQIIINLHEYEEEKEKKSPNIFENPSDIALAQFTKNQNEHLFVECDMCKRNSNSCKVLFCSHNICTNCLKNVELYICPFKCSLRMCNICKIIKICQPEGLKLEYLCEICIKQNNQISKCVKCNASFGINRLKCGHIICNKCNIYDKKACPDCMKKEQLCFICYTTDFDKIVASCDHISCTNCYKHANRKCLECSFLNQRNSSKAQIRELKCVNCSKNKLKGLRLLCNDFICEDCAGIKWKFLNFRCIECYKQRKCDEKCLCCLQAHRFVIKKEGIFKECCNELIGEYFNR